MRGKAYAQNPFAELYAEAGVPEYWIVNLHDEVVEVATDPRDGICRSLRTLARGESISLVSFPDVTFDVGELLP